mmetsp:Transcript_7721/g.17807  ORF Transcript_7721/g.17807 Transcript_7721/m.17807 type:complete len:115 (+) Transcript_7721:364-708(+)
MASCVIRIDRGMTQSAQTMWVFLSCLLSAGDTKKHHHQGGHDCITLDLIHDRFHILFQHATDLADKTMDTAMSKYGHCECWSLFCVDTLHEGCMLPVVDQCYNDEDQTNAGKEG